MSVLDYIVDKQGKDVSLKIIRTELKIKYTHLLI